MSSGCATRRARRSLTTWPSRAEAVITSRQLIVLIVFIAVEAAGLALAKLRPSGIPSSVAPIVMTAALVGFMVWIYLESRKEGHK